MEAIPFSVVTVDCFEPGKCVLVGDLLYVQRAATPEATERLLAEATMDALRDLKARGLLPADYPTVQRHH